MNANNDCQVFTIAPIGHAYIPETMNAAAKANGLQASFKFVVDARPVTFEAAKYRFKNDAIDFVRAIGDLKDEEVFKGRLSDELILVTSDPDSDSESATDYADQDHPLHEQCYFYHDSFSFARSWRLSARMSGNTCRSSRASEPRRAASGRWSRTCCTALE
jgi:hypothetical protein